MNDKDSKLIFENYMQNITEAPVGLGSSWEDDDIASQFDKGEIDKLSKYKVGSPELVNQIAAEVKEFISEHEGKVYPGTVKEFKTDIINLVKDIADIGNANGKYAARVIANTLSRLDFIDIDAATLEVKVDDNINPDKVEKAVKNKIEGIVTLQLRHDYEIGSESGQTPDSEADKAFNLITQGLGRGFTSTGRNIIDILRKDMSLSHAQAVANELLRSDGILVPEAEEDDEQKEIDLGRDVDRGDDRYAAGDYADQHFGDMGSGSMSDY